MVSAGSEEVVPSSVFEVPRYNLVKEAKRYGWQKKTPDNCKKKCLVVLGLIGAGGVCGKKGFMSMPPGPDGYGNVFKSWRSLCHEHLKLEVENRIIGGQFDEWDEQQSGRPNETIAGNISPE